MSFIKKNNIDNQGTLGKRRSKCIISNTPRRLLFVVLVIIAIIIGGVFFIDQDKSFNDSNVIDVTKSGFASMSRSPKSGEVYLRPHYSRLLNELQTKHDQFLISFYVYDQDGSHLSRDKTMEECVRLASLGYQIYLKPSTQFQCDHEIVGVFSVDELNSMVFNDNYGYCFGDVWNSGNDLLSLMDEELRVIGRG